MVSTHATGSPESALLTVAGLTFSYGGMRILENVDFRLEAGEVVALLGRSGSGKSTLLNLLAGIDAADGGSVQIEGRNLASLDDRSRTLFRRRHIGFIYQFFNLVESLTALENVALPLELNGAGRSSALTGAAGMLAAVGLEDRGHHLPDQLSGGEQQRVAVARALVHGPDLVLADEPTGNLDLATGRRILRLLQDQVTERGTTLLLVTHSDEVADCARRVLVLEDGRLREGGPQ